MISFRSIVIYILIGLLSLQSSFAAIPNQYFPNYTIDSRWKNVLEMLVKVEAYRKTGNNVPASVFAQLNSDFGQIFPSFPQSPSYKVIYEQCLLTTQALSSSYQYDKFVTFTNQCFEPLNTILKDLSSRYTMMAKIVATPKGGPAPFVVTLDARGSSDPSNDTIPSTNYFWRFKDIDGIEKTIGQGPVVNYTFTKPGNYIVHLTVRSVNSADGVLDGESSVAIDVQPQSSLISVYANGKKLKKDDYMKMSSQEAKDGVTLDGTSTTPTGGRKLMRHRRTITSSDQFNVAQDGQGNPSVIKVSLPSNGLYTVTLSTTDNENNTIAENFQIVVSDPVALIKMNPEQGDTSTRMNFDASSSYSVSNKIKIYKREIFDTAGVLVQTTQSKTLEKQFIKPGLYTIKLTIVDQLGQSNIDQTKINIESTTPIPQFTITPTQKRLSPSQFVLDAGPSSDVDALNSFDTLSYEWKFSKSDSTKIEKVIDKGHQIIVSFNEIGTHQVSLIVKDGYGKYNEITKDIKIDSSVRPSVTVNPIATTRGSPISFQVKSNKPIINYEWDFADSSTKTIQSDSLSHTFGKVGVYRVKLRVFTQSLEENTLEVPVFIGDSKSPIAIYDILNDNNLTIVPMESCTDTDNKNQQAYGVSRYGITTIDAAMSLNTKGQTSNTKIYFKPQNEDISKVSQLKWKFGELGCTYVDLTVEDTSESTVDKKRIWFKVQNALPQLTNLLLSYPQYGEQNTIGIGFFGSKKSVVDQYDPLVVKIMADGLVDKDGQISYISRYYYKSDDPDRLLDIKITPGSTPNVTFALSREAGEYNFGAKFYDNDGGEIRSEDIIGKGPVVFLQPKGSDSNDIPIVTLKSDQSNVKIGDEVQFEVFAKILSNRDDFKANRIIKYDFDGDGADDLTTKDDRVKRIYEKASSLTKGYRPKVKILYREKVGTALGEPITVQKGVKPRFIYQTIGKKVLLKNTTVGAETGSQTLLCLNMKKCATDRNYIKSEPTTLLFEYPEYGNYMVKMEVKDSYGNSASFKDIIKLAAPTAPKYLELVTLPELQSGSNGLSLEVGKNLDNTIDFIGIYGGTGTCTIQIEESDYTCGEMHTVRFKTPNDTSSITLSYSNAAGLTQKVIPVRLIDNQTIVPEKYKTQSDSLLSLIEEMQGNTDLVLVKTHLNTLRRSLGDKAKTTETILDTQKVLEEKGDALPAALKQKITTVLNTLSDSATKAAQGATPYEQAKSEILALMAPDAKLQLQGLFDQIDAADGDKSVIYYHLTGMMAITKSEVEKGNTDPMDYEVIKTQLCKIVAYKEIGGTKCDGGSDTKVVPVVATTTTSNNSPLKTVLKWTGIIAGTLILIFFILVLVFALKAKMQQKKEQTPEVKV